MGDDQSDNELVKAVMEYEVPVSTTLIVSGDELNRKCPPGESDSHVIY